MNHAALALSYTPTPAGLPAGHGPVELAIAVRNRTSQPLRCGTLGLTLPVGTEPEALTSRPDAVSLALAAPHAGWSLQADGHGGFLAEPPGGEIVLAPDDGFVLLLRGLEIHGSAGNAVLTVAERTAPLAGEVQEARGGVAIAKDAAGLSITGFSASPIALAPGQPCTLRWATHGADHCTLTGSDGTAQDGPASGTQEVHPHDDVTYMLTAVANGATAHAQVQVRVIQPQILAFGPADGGLGWTTAHADRVELTLPDGTTSPVAPAGQLAAGPGTYTLTAYGVTGAAAARTYALEGKAHGLPATVALAAAPASPLLSYLVTPDTLTTHDRPGERVTGSMIVSATNNTGGPVRCRSIGLTFPVGTAAGDLVGAGDGFHVTAVSSAHWSLAPAGPGAFIATPDNPDAAVLAPGTTVAFICSGVSAGTQAGAASVQVAEEASPAGALTAGPATPRAARLVVNKRPPAPARGPAARLAGAPAGGVGLIRVLEAAPAPDRPDDITVLRWDAGDATACTLVIGDGSTIDVPPQGTCALPAGTVPTRCVLAGQHPDGSVERRWVELMLDPPGPQVVALACAPVAGKPNSWRVSWRLRGARTVAIQPWPAGKPVVQQLEPGAERSGEGDFQLVAGDEPVAFALACQDEHGRQTVACCMPGLPHRLL